MNTEKVNFDQCLECAAHKCWSKYTTMGESKPWEKEKVEQEKSLIIEYLSPFLQELPLQTSLYVATLWLNTSLFMLKRHRLMIISEQHSIVISKVVCGLIVYLPIPSLTIFRRVI